MRMLIHLMLLHNPLKLSSLFFILLLWLDEFHCPFQVHCSFLLLHVVRVELCYWIFQFIYRFCILQLCDLCSVLSYIFSLLKFQYGSSIFSSEFGEHLYDCYFEPFTGNSLNLYFIKVFFILFFHWNWFLYFPWFSVLVSMHYIKQSPLPILKEWPCVENEPYHSILP